MVSTGKNNRPMPGPMTTVKRRALLRLGRSLALACLLLPWPILQAQSSPLRMLHSADVHPEEYPTVQAVLHMHQVVQEKSRGRLGIQVFHSAQLGDEELLARQVAAGQFDMNRLNVQALAQIAPEIGVLSLPFLFRDEAHLHKVIDGEIGRELLAGLNRYGLVGLAFYEGGTRSVYTREKPVTQLKELKGLLMRVQASAISRRTFELLGTKPVEIPYAHIGRALSNKLVDAAENSINAYASAGHYLHAPYYTLTQHSMPPEVLVMSAKTWDSLTEADQQILRSAAAESVGIMRGMWIQRQERVEAMLRLKGVQFLQISPRERHRMIEAISPVHADSTRDPAVRAMVARIKAVK